MNHDAAQQAYRQALNSIQQGDQATAVQQLQCCLKHHPEHLPAINELAMLFSGSQQYDAAESMLRHALQRAPEHRASRLNLALVLQNSGQPEQALPYYRALLQEEPDNSPWWSNFGNACAAAGSEDAAEQALQRAIALREDNLDAHYNLGFFYQNQGKTEQGLRCFERVLHSQPDHAAAWRGCALAWLGQGDLQRAWPAYERAVYGSNPRQLHFGQQRWQGENLAGKRLLVMADQGIGDELRFLSCLPDLLAQGAEVSYECDARLCAWFQDCFPAVRFFARQLINAEAWHSLLQAHDLACYNIALPCYLRQKLSDFPATDTALLHAPQAQRQQAKDWLRQHGDGPFVGLAWRSQLMNTVRARFHLPDTAVYDWIGQSKTPLVCLQYDVSAAEKKALQHQHGQRLRFPPMDLKNDFLALSGLMAELDQVISTGNCTYAVAGALAIPTRLLLPRPANTQLGMAPAYPWFPSVQGLYPAPDQPMSNILHHLNP